MKHLLISIALILGLVTAEAAVTYAPLQVNKSTDALPPGSTFFTANSNSVVDIVGKNFGLSTVIIVSPNGDDASAVVGNAAKPFKTIGAATAAAPNNTVIQVLPGTYAQTGDYINPQTTSGLGSIPVQIINKTNIQIIGTGAKITGSGDLTHIGLLNTKDITISGLTLDLVHGNGDTITNSFLAAIQNFGTNMNTSFIGVSVKGATDQGICSSRLQFGYTFDRCYFFHIGTTNVWFLQHPTPSTSFPYVDGTAISGLGSDTRIVNCFFDTVYRATEWDEAISTPTLHSGMIIANNTVTNCMHYAFGVYSPQSVSHIRDISITGNRIHMMTNSPGLGTTFSAIDSRLDILAAQNAILLDAGVNVSVTGNTIDNFYDTGILLAASSPIKQVVLSGNSINGVTNNSACTGIRLINSSAMLIDSVNIVGNMISSIGGNGMLISGANVNISQNQFTDIGMAAASNPYHILASSEASTVTSNLVVRGNFGYSRKASFQPFGTAISSQPAYSVKIGSDNQWFGCLNAQNSWNAGNAANIEWDGQQGVATLVAGTATVANNLVKAGSKIFLTTQTRAGGSPGVPMIYSQTAGTGFVITNSVGTSDTSTIAWRIHDSR